MGKRPLKIFFFAALAALAPQARANVSKPGLWLPAILSDHMVLQQDKPVKIWGWAGPGEELRLKFADLHMRCRADETGAWSFSLPEMNPGGPYDMQIIGRETVVIHDVLIGEVWLASGDAGLERPLGADAGASVTAQAQIRFFVVERHGAFDRQKDLKGGWRLSNPESLKTISAEAWHFALELQPSLKMPLGLIVAAWAGSSGEDWVPRADLDAMPALQPLLRQWDGDADSQRLWSTGSGFDLQVAELRFVPADPAMKAPLFKADWSHAETRGSDGDILSQGKTSLHYHGLIQGAAQAAAGTLLAQPDLSGQAALEFRARGQGSFALALGVSGEAEPYASEPFALTGDWQLQHVALKELRQRGWERPAALDLHSVQSLSFMAQAPQAPGMAALAFNGMIAPLQGFGIRGVLLDEGQANLARAGDYADLLGTQMQSWRRIFDDDSLPFLVMPLGPPAAPCDPSCQSQRQELGQAQREACALTATALVNAPVQTAARAALGLVYGNQGPAADAGADK
jgi:sialate O-acetylesterase